jgi:hypothetical protein
VDPGTVCASSSLDSIASSTGNTGSATAVLELLSEDADHGLTLFHRARPPPLLEV